MAAGTKSSESAPGFGREILAIVGGFVGIFLLLCLVSYRYPADPATWGEPGANWGGVVGQIAAHMLFSVLGLAAFWLVFLTLFFSIRGFFPGGLSLERFPAVFAGCTGMILATSSLLAAISGGQERLSFFGQTVPGGGHAGAFLHGILSALLGGPGSALFFLALFLVSAMLTLHLSPSSLVLLAREQITRYRARAVAGKGLAKVDAKREAAAAPLREDGKESPPASEPVIVTPRPRVHEPLPPAEGHGEEEFAPLPIAAGGFTLPALSLLDTPPDATLTIDKEHYFTVSRQLEEKLGDFGVEGKVVGISPGPVITTYEFSPAPGIKINKVVSLAEDLALGLKAESVRIVGSIPGKAAIGIEIPNPERQTVYLREILGHEKFQKAGSKLTIGLGKDVVGNPVVANLARMPHLLIAGATGSGKSVAVNGIICSILLKATPEEVRLLMVDPKRIELSVYDEIPHLLHPVVTDPKMAARALQWAVREMERRYETMEELRVKSLASYNEIADEKLPLIVIIIDELADLMMVSSREVEDAVARLAQMARAAGMHLILATQRPSVDVLTGLIKANFPTRMSFKVSSKIDSRTILDTSGAEHLLGAGDMLFLPPGAAKLQRIHGAYISEKETERIVSFLKSQSKARYDESVLQEVVDKGDEEAVGEEEYDEKYDEAVAMVCETGQASISMVQRRLRVGYNRAARMIEIMEKEGIVSAADGVKPREVLARRNYQ